MDWDKIAEGVRIVAPTVASLMGGPLAGTAVSVLGNVILGKPNASHEEVMGALGNLTPEMLGKVKQAEAELQAKLKELDIQVDQLHQEDRADARNRQIELKDHIPGYLIGTVTVGFFGLLAVMSFHGVPAENRDLVNVMLGALGTGWSSGMMYFFGSSRGADRMIRGAIAAP